jgi:hypothetical protein
MTMLGDAGSNAPSAVLSLGPVKRSRGRGRWFALLGLATLTAAAQLHVLGLLREQVPLLRELGAKGSQP